MLHSLCSTRQPTLSKDASDGLFKVSIRGRQFDLFVSKQVSFQQNPLAKFQNAIGYLIIWGSDVLCLSSYKCTGLPMKSCQALARISSFLCFNLLEIFSLPKSRFSMNLDVTTTFPEAQSFSYIAQAFRPFF